MLSEPPLPIDTDAADPIKLYLEGAKVVAYVHSLALPSLLYDFWYLTAKSQRGGEMSLWGSDEQPHVPGCVSLGLCEITLAGEGPVMGILHNPTADLRQGERRVDLSVNRTQAEHGYELLRKLGALKEGRLIESVELFGRLIIRLIA